MISFIFHPETLPFIVDWEAWSTLAVGIAAVLGAYKIGVRQTGIAEHQTKILSQQAALEQTKLRAELYDRRASVVEAAERYIQQASIAEAAAPREYLDSLIIAIGESRFLFGEEVTTWLRAVYAAGTRLSIAKGRLCDAGDQPPEQHLDAVYAGHDELNALLAELKPKFNPYLGLADTP